MIEYLQQPLDRATLERLLGYLPDPASDLVRVDKHFKELGLDATAYEEPDSVIELLLTHPRLMQRPVFVTGERAVIARPSEKVLELL